MSDKIKYWITQWLSILSILSVLICIFFYIALPIITRHGEAISVPNLFEKTPDEARRILGDKKLRVDFVANSAYRIKSPENTIIQQYPRVGSFVKKNRTIYLTINTNTSKHIVMPNLVDHTIRNAYMVLKSVGLVLGKIEYVEDIAHNGVLEQYYDGVKVLPGKTILVGSTIDLLVGVNSKERTVLVPEILIVNLEDVELFLLSSHLRLGKIKYFYSDKYAPGTIISQTPLAKEKVVLGTFIDLCIANDEGIVVDSDNQIALAVDKDVAIGSNSI